MNPNKNRSVSRSASPTSPRPAVNTWGLCVNGSNTVTPDIIVNHRRTVLCQLVSLISVPNTNPLFVSARPNRETPSDTSHFHIAGERSNTSSPRLVISKSTREAFPFKRFRGPFNMPFKQHVSWAFNISGSTPFVSFRVTTATLTRRRRRWS